MECTSQLVQVFLFHMYNFIVSGNRAKNFGGGMFLSTTSKIIMEDLTFTSNLAEKGGGLYVADDEEKTACLEGNSCFLQIMLIRSPYQSKLFLETILQP